VHQSLAGALDKALAHIQRIQADARAPDAKLPPVRPALADDHPGHAQGLDRAEGSGWLAGGRHLARPSGADREVHKPEHVQQLEAWLRSYKPAELFDENGKFRDEFATLAPTGRRRMGFNPHANGGQLLTAAGDAALSGTRGAVPAPGSTEAEATRVLGGFLREVMR
jgi:xylulose-5-phosphate/fructose-6-phosphate phosphoketolase